MPSLSSGRHAGSRRAWSLAGTFLLLAEWQAWSGARPWALVGLSMLALAWFWRKARLEARHQDRAAQAQAHTHEGSKAQVDPALAAIREIWMDDAVPRIVVNAEHPGVQVPGHVRERWKHQLVIDLDPRYPLRLEVGFEGCAVDLSFGGEVSRCIFAWPSIYTVQNRGSGAAVVIETRIPDAIARGSES